MREIRMLLSHDILGAHARWARWWRRQLGTRADPDARKAMASLAALLGKPDARPDDIPDLARGEITLVIAGAAGEGGGDAALLARALPLLLRDLPPARAAAIAAQLSGVPRPLAYEHARRLARDNGAEQS